MDFQESLEKLKESKWAVPTYIVAVILATIGVAYLNTCLATILIPVIMFAVPYFMGEKRLKYFLLLGVIIIVVDSVAFGLLDANYLSNYEAKEQSSPDGTTIAQGFVSPTVGDADTLFTFTVVITANYTNVSEVNFQAYVNISETSEYDSSSDTTYQLNESNPLDIDASDGKSFNITIQLPAKIHFFHFSANVDGTWHNTLKHDDLSDADFSGLGPVNADSFYIFQTFFMNALVFMVFTSILFLIFVMMYWWMGKSKIERAKWDERLREAGELEVAEAKLPESDLECTNCGRPVHEDAVRCPHCGAIFEEEETEEQSKPKEQDV